MQVIWSWIKWTFLFCYEQNAYCDLCDFNVIISVDISVAGKGAQGLDEDPNH